MFVMQIEPHMTKVIALPGNAIGHVPDAFGCKAHPKSSTRSGRGAPKACGLRVAATLALFAGLAMSQESAPTSRSTATIREAGVLEVLNEIVVSSNRAGRLHQTQKEDSDRSDRVNSGGPFPRKVCVCGNSYFGVIDVTMARERAQRLFEAYGVPLSKNVAIEGEGIRGVLDGFSESTGLGFEMTVGRKASFGVTAPSEESAAEALTADEVSLIEAGTKRILHVHQSSYGVIDGDEVLAQAYWAAAVIGFLNEAVGGPDVDLGAALWGDYQLMDLGLPRDAATGEELPTTMLGRADDEPRLAEGRCRRSNLWRPTTIRFTIGVAEKHRMESWGRAVRGAPATEALERPVSTKGRLSGLAFAVIGPGPGNGGRTLSFDNFFFWNPVRLEQVDADGHKWSIEALGPRFFSPSWFDAARPFVLEVTLPIGSHPMPSHIAVTR